MKSIYVVIDRTDANIYKAFTDVCYTEKKATEIVANKQESLSGHAKYLISYEACKVDDFKKDQKTIYVVFNKTDHPKMKTYHSMHFDAAHAETIVKNLQQYVGDAAKKLIYFEPVTIQ